MPDGIFKSNLRFQGFFRLHTTDASGKITKDTGFFHNLITNSGLDFIGNSGDFTATCSVGLGTTPPAVTDVTLQSWLAGVFTGGGTGCNINKSYNPGPPAYWQGQRSWQFAAGTATGNIAEIGVGPGTSSTPSPTDPLFSRALVVDSGGNPTVIPVLATEALTVTYVLVVHLDLTDTSYTMTLSGTPYSGIFRRSNVTVIPSLGLAIGTASTGCVVWAGSIGPVTGAPSGTGSGGGIYVNPNTYVPGSYSSTTNFTFGINLGNVGGINSIQWLWGGSAGYFQLSVSPTIPKTSTYIMTLSSTVSWSRYP